MSTSTDKNVKSFEYKIEDIKAFKAAKNVQEFQSAFFEFASLKWCLRIYPNGSNKSKKGNVNCFLWLRSLPPKYSKIAVDVKLSLKEANVNASFPHQFTDNHLTRGWLTGPPKIPYISRNSITIYLQIFIICTKTQNLFRIKKNQQKEH